MHQWKSIPGFAKYEACTDGRIRHKCKGTMLQPGGTRGGYQRVSLYANDEIRWTRSVHQLVALTYLDNPDKKATVNHKDHDPRNNHVENLEWASATEQNRHKRKCMDRSLVSARAVQQIEPYTTNILAIFPFNSPGSGCGRSGSWGKDQNLCSCQRSQGESDSIRVHVEICS